MTTIAVLPESSAPRSRFHAVSGKHQSVGNTPGEALDGVAARLPSSESGALVVLQEMRPDQFFTAEQQKRLRELMDRWRAARDGRGDLTVQEQIELERLTAEELDASTKRAEAWLRELRP